MSKSKFNNYRLKELRKDDSIENYVFKLRTAGLDISTHTYRRWESGESIPDAQEIAFLCNYHEIMISDLYDFKGKVKK